MIFIGGVTRLTNSGLSIVEWKPVTGVIPPLSNEDWQKEFTQYKTSPEYQQRNIYFAISEFKFIFWLEFIHRFAGRVTGLIYLLPLIYFYIKGKIKQDSILSYSVILILFFAQGFMGWYMVKSGLITQPYVSHYRLASHLLIAIIIYHLLFYQLMKNNFDILLMAHKISFRKPQFFCLLSIIMIYVQIFLGALVAGLNAGLVYNSFPLMGKNFIPAEIMNNFISLTNWNKPVFIQFIHRIGAYIICIIIGFLVISLLKIKHSQLNKVAYCIICVLLLQMLAGIINILCSVPIVVALIHQFLAIVLLSYVLWCHFLIQNAYTISA